MLKKMLKIAGLVLLVALALLAYTFVPMKLDVAGNQSGDAFSTNHKPDTLILALRNKF